MIMGKIIGWIGDADVMPMTGTSPLINGDQNQIATIKSGLGIDVPFWGICFTTPKQPYLLDMKYPLFSWVM